MWVVERVAIASKTHEGNDGWCLKQLNVDVYYTDTVSRFNSTVLKFHDFSKSVYQSRR